MSHLILYGFVYPAEQSRVPTWVTQELLQRLQSELRNPLPLDSLCQGTLLSRAQYCIDIAERGYRDARLVPTGRMTTVDIAHWTAAIAREEEADDHSKRMRACSSGR